MNSGWPTSQSSTATKGLLERIRLMRYLKVVDLNQGTELDEEIREERRGMTYLPTPLAPSNTDLGLIFIDLQTRSPAMTQSVGR